MNLLNFFRWVCCSHTFYGLAHGILPSLSWHGSLVVCAKGMLQSAQPLSLMSLPQGTEAKEWYVHQQFNECFSLSFFDVRSGSTVALSDQPLIRHVNAFNTC